MRADLRAGAIPECRFDDLYDCVGLRAIKDQGMKAVARQTAQQPVRFL